MEESASIRTRRTGRTERAETRRQEARCARAVNAVLHECRRVRDRAVVGRHHPHREDHRHAMMTIFTFILVPTLCGASLRAAHQRPEEVAGSEHRR